MKIGFSGHETFVCRHFWLKKGVDFLLEGGSFSSEEAVVELGVGKNMTTAIRFWLRAFHIVSDDSVTELGNYLFSGKDPYLEDTASLWLLHYSIIRHEKAFIFNSFFNDFLKEKTEFTRDQLISFLKRKTEEAGMKLFSDKTYESDVNVFLRTYHRSQDGKADLEEETSNLLIDLNLIRPFRKQGLEGKPVQWFRVLREQRDEIPLSIYLFALLDRYGGRVQSVAFRELLDGHNSMGSIFSLTEKGLEDLLKQISDQWPRQLTFSDTAGNRVLQIKNEIDKWRVLDEYYG